MEPLRERSSNFLIPGLPHNNGQHRRKSFSEASPAAGLMNQLFPRRPSYVVRSRFLIMSISLFWKVGVEGSLVPTDLAGRGRRKSWVGEVGEVSPASSSGEGGQQGSSGRVRRGSLVATESGWDVDNHQGGEGGSKRLREQVQVMQG